MKMYKLVLTLIILVLLIGILIPLFTLPLDQYWLVIKPFCIFLIPAIMLGVLLAVYPICSLKQMVLIFVTLLAGLFILMIFTRIHLIGTFLYGIGSLVMIFVKHRAKKKNMHTV
jgi:peptidoglycan/LPS O-acetylase OafA/YrhL